MTHAIAAQGLTKTYASGTVALRDASVAIEEGWRFALLGPNGAGKTTLVRLLTTLSAPDSGRITLFDRDLYQDRSNAHRMIGLVSQEDALDPNETPSRLLRFQGRLFGLSRKDAATRAAELTAGFRLESEAEKKVSTLSGGNKKRLHCALGIVHCPRVLFLDEPTVGMDPEARAQFWSVLRGLSDEKRVTIILTTQYLEEADKHAERMALLIDGELHYDGAVEAFKRIVLPEAAGSLEEAYLAYVRALAASQATPQDRNGGV